MDRRAAAVDGRLPTLADAAGLPDLEDMSVWLGLVAPKGTPKPIIDKLQQKVAQILADPAVRGKIRADRQLSMTSTPEEFARFIRQEADRWCTVLRGNQHQVRLSACAHRTIWEHCHETCRDASIAACGLLAR